MNHKYSWQDFEQYVADIFKLLEYEVERSRNINGRQIDVVAVKNEPPVPHLLVCECKHYSRNIGVDLIGEFHNKLLAAQRENPGYRGIFVTSSGFTDDAKNYADSLGITYRTIQELESSLFDFSKHLLHINRIYQSRPISSIYIDPLILDIQANHRSLLSEFVPQWLSRKLEDFITILGDYGVGKSSLCLHVAHTMAKEHRQDFLSPIPFFVDLGEYKGEKSAEHILLNELSKECRHLNNLDVFRELLSRGRIVLLLDGFDELTPNIHTNSTLHIFSQFASFAKTGGKILLTSRTHYFLDDFNESQVVLRQTSSTQPSRKNLAKLRRLVKSLRYGRYYLSEFTDEQIHHYIEKSFPSKEHEKVLKLLREIYNLEDLSRRPILLYLITKVYDELKNLHDTEGKITSTELYQFFIDYWIEHDDERVNLTRLGKEVLVEEIAWKLWTQNLRHIHWRKIPEMLARYFKNDLQMKDGEYAAHEIRTASFLIRNRQGYYRFAHQSFLEFFAAKRMSRTIDSGDYSIIENGLRIISREIARFIGGCVCEPTLLAEKYIEFHHDVLLTWKIHTYSEFPSEMSGEEQETFFSIQQPSLRTATIFYELSIPCVNKLTGKIKTSSEIIDEMLSVLTPQEALVVRHILGIGVSPLTLSEIGQHVLNGVTRERPRQIMKLALNKLQAKCYQIKFKKLLFPMLGISVEDPSSEEMLQMKLTDLVWVSGGAYNVLTGKYSGQESRPKNIKELLQLSKGDLAKWRTCGKKTIQEIVAAVESLGFQMRK